MSRALKDGPEVRPKTKQMVLEAAERLDYIPHQGGFFLRTGKTNTIAMILSPEPQSAFPAMVYMYYFQGKLRMLADSHFTLSIHPRLPHEDLLLPIQRIVEGRKADGLIIGQTRDQDTRVKYLLEREFPFVTFGRTELFTPHPFYDVDHEHLTYHSTQRLLEAGHRRIAIMNPPEFLNYTGLRLRGYRRIIVDAGLQVDPALIHNSDLSFETGCESMNRFLKLDPPPTAFIAPGVSSALGMLNALQNANLKLGVDVGLIAFEGTNFLEFNSPGISAYHASLEAAGERLCSLLLRRLNGENATDLQHVQTSEYLERESG